LCVCVCVCGDAGMEVLLAHLLWTGRQDPLPTTNPVSNWSLVECVLHYVWEKASLALTLVVSRFIFERPVKLLWSHDHIR